MKNRWKQCLCLALALVVLASLMPEARAQGGSSGSDRRILVAMGDSYSSGEGIEPFFYQDSDIRVRIQQDDWLAHRSKKAWSGMLELPDANGNMIKMSDKHWDGTNDTEASWYFVAASGAEIEHFFHTRLAKPYFKIESYDLFSNTLSIAQKNDAESTLPLQGDIFTHLKGKKIDYVTLTIGGNDAGFVPIVTEAFTGCDFLAPHKLTSMIVDTVSEIYKPETGIQQRLINAYKEIYKATNKQPVILVAGYPKLVPTPEDRSDMNPVESVILYGKRIIYTLDSNECRTLNLAVRLLNSAIEEAVARCQTDGVNIDFVPVFDAFLGHEAGTAHPFINGAVLRNPQELNVAIEQDPETGKRYAPLSNLLSAYSFHPNEAGARAYADCVQAKIDELEGVERDPVTREVLSVSKPVKPEAVAEVTETEAEPSPALSTPAPEAEAEPTPTLSTPEPELQYRIRRVTEYLYDANTVSFYNDYHYGADGRLADITKHNPDGSIEQQRVYEYNPDGTPSAEWWYLGDPSSGRCETYLTRYLYNSAGEKITEKVYAAGMEDEAMIEWRHDYTYENGLLIRDDRDNGWAMNSQVYDYEGSVLQSASWYFNDKYHNEGPILSEQTTYIYDPDGKLSRSSTVDGSGKEHRYVDYTYDGNGNLSEEVTYEFFNEYVDFSGKTTYDAFMLSSRKVYDYEPVPAEAGQSSPANTTASETGGNELYVPLIQSFIEEAKKERYAYFQTDHGMLCDLDGDADDELLIFYRRYISEAVAYNEPMVLCGVYDIRDGRVEPVFERIEICCELGGNYGEAGIASLDGKPYLYTRYSTGAGTPSLEETILYDCRECRVAFSYVHGYTMWFIDDVEQITDESYELNGSPCSEAEYSEALSKITFIDGIDMYESGRTLDEVLETIVGS